MNDMRTKRRQAPLRRVVNWYTNGIGRLIEVLECGHEQGRLSDAFGETNASRRRCLKCLAAPALRETAAGEDTTKETP